MNYIPPEHYTLENIAYLLKKYPINRLLITEKIDGIYQSTSDTQYELVGNRKYIFNSSNNIILEPKDYMEFRKMVEVFRNNLEGDIINKPYYRLNQDIIDHIDEIINWENILTDGWILIGDDFQDIIIKLKPIKHLTIDLFFDTNKNKWFTRDGVIDLNVYNTGSTGIWRLYWENNYWVAKDRRYDKSKPNNYKIVKDVINFINKPFSLKNLIDTILSKQLYYQINRKIKNQDTLDYIEHNNNFIKSIINKYVDPNKKILDIGCGKGKYLSLDRYQPIGKYLSLYRYQPIGKYLSNASNWYGLDIDLGALYLANKRGVNGIWLDFLKKWDPVEQIKSLGSLWKYYSSSLFELKTNKFDTILWLYSLHFCLDETCLSNVFDEINLLTKKDSILVLNLVKMDFNKIVLSNGYIVRKDNYLFRYYDWCNDKEQKERIWLLEDILRIGKEWEVKEIIEMEMLEDNSWNEWSKNNYICILYKQ